MVDKILAGIAALALLIVVGVIGYNEFSYQQITVLVSLKENEDPLLAIKQIMPLDSRITNIQEIDHIKNQYVLTVTTKRAKGNLLEWLLRSSRVENAEIQSKLLNENKQ